VRLFGVLEVHRLRRNDLGHRELPWDDLIRDLSPAARAVVAKAARSEVKNYMAEVAEQAGVPFGGPAEFVRRVHCQHPNCMDAEHPVCKIACDGRP